MEQLYTVSEVMALLKYSERTIRAFIKDGKINHVRTSTGRVRIPESEVKKLMNKENK